MSKKPDELQAGALNAWTPLQQAALYQNYLSKVKENEEGEKLKAYETAEAEKKKGPKVKPEAIKAGKVIDDLVKDWCPPLFAFLDVFGPPHLAIIGYLGAHAAFWSVSPWYLHHLLVYPTLYLIPLFNAYVSISSRKDRMIWQVWLMELCLVEYLEQLFFRDSASSLLWWPKMKALIFVLLYCRIGSEEGKTDPRTRVREKVKVYGCMLVIKPWLDSIENEHKEKEKAEKEKKEKEKEKEKEKDGKEEDKGKSSKDGDKDKEKARAKAKAAAKAKASGK